MTYVWDLPVRLFHWLLVVTVVVAYFTGTEGGLWLDWHAFNGVIVLALLAFRVTWGFVGSPHARFCSFFPTPGRLKAYFNAQWTGVGHTPLGGLSVLAMLMALLLQAATGLFAMEDEMDFHGPLYFMVSGDWNERMTNWHHLVFDAVVVLIGLHLAAMIYYASKKGRTFLTAMLTGRSMQAGNNRTCSHPGKKAGLFRTVFAVGIGALTYATIDNGELLYRWLIYP